MNVGAQIIKRNRERLSATRKASPARRTAFEVLRRVEEEGAYAAPLLAGATEHLRVDDRALCYELVLGVLRWQLWLDRLTEHYAGRGADRIDAPVRRALRLGLYQLRLLTRVPASAAVNESVNLVHESRLRSAAGFINAVLRRATREPVYDPTKGIADPIERIAVRTSHPPWLIGRWVAAFGAEEAEAFAASNNRTPSVAFRLNPLRQESGAATVVAQLKATGAKISESRIAPGAWCVEGANGALLRALVEDGAIYLQDEASQLVARALGACLGERVLDVCAAPGSKTTHLAALAEDQAFVVAGDIHEHRLRVVGEAASRQGLKSIRRVAFDAAAGVPFAAGTFDRVLIDAPCTGTGTLRHNPEIRWRITPTDFAELAARQQGILAGAADAVRIGGLLVYSTCSVEREENESVIEEFLRAHVSFRQVPVETSETLVVGGGAARTWPHKHDVDGFFIAALVRGG